MWKMSFPSSDPPWERHCICSAALNHRHARRVVERPVWTLSERGTAYAGYALDHPWTVLPVVSQQPRAHAYGWGRHCRCSVSLRQGLPKFDVWKFVPSNYLCLLFPCCSFPVPRHAVVPDDLVHSTLTGVKTGMAKSFCSAAQNFTKQDLVNSLATAF